MHNEIDGRLLKKNNHDYIVTHKRPFNGSEKISTKYVIECINFSYDMAYGSGSHREHRSGGTYERKPGEIFANTLQGKIAEFAMYSFMLQNKLDASYPDMTVSSKGIWDSFDIECYGKKIAVKSTKFYGQLLLLEAKDWNEQAEYIPNYDKDIKNYDFFVLIRISPSVEDIMKKHKMLYSNSVTKEYLKSIFVEQEWKYDIAGYITKGDFSRIIEVKYTIPKGAKLNDTTIMDAENYYVQAGDMRDSNSFVRIMQYYKKLVKE